MNQTVLYLVIPCYNEEAVLRDTANKLLSYFESTLFQIVSRESHVLFVDDGSSDATWRLICDLHKENALFEGIRLSANQGHQIALFAGMITAAQYADAIITIDADLQQDILAIPRFLEQYHNGCDIVYGIRNSRSTDRLFKKWTATIYYKLMRALGVNLIEQSADYRLLSARAARALSMYKESHLFIRGLIPTLGFQTGVVHFDVQDRALGESKYTLRKMLRLAADGITSFTMKPLSIVFGLGVIISVISLVLIIQAIWARFYGTPISGWASLTVSIWFLGGVNFIALGIIGEYVGRTYIESKNRPRYFITEEQVHQCNEPQRCLNETNLPRKH